MSTSNDGGHGDLRFARYLAGVSRFTRAIGILAVFGSVLLILVTQSSVRSSSDRVGFTLVSLTVLLFGVLVWGVGVFHGTFAVFVRRVAAIDGKLDALGQMLARASSNVPVVAVQDAVAPTESPANAPSDVQGVAARQEIGPAATDARGPVSERAPAEPQGAAASVSVTEPERTPCPHCGGSIHPQATRCVHCMKKVAR